ncbi:MAG: hypothetical protein AAF436_03095 [Myxococcota bacterium]
MGASDEKLSELQAALDDLGVDAGEVSAVLRRFEGKREELASVDAELEALSADIEVTPIAGVTVDPSAFEARVPEAAEAPAAPEETAAQDSGSPDEASAADEWESDKTEVEIIDEADDFVLLVDEGDLEELEAASDEVPRVTAPPPLPASGEAGEADEDDEEQDDEDDGFFKKLFGSRRSSNRP